MTAPDTAAPRAAVADAQKRGDPHLLVLTSHVLWLLDEITRLTAELARFDDLDSFDAEERQRMRDEITRLTAERDEARAGVRAINDLYQLKIRDTSLDAAHFESMQTRAEAAETQYRDMQRQANEFLDRVATLEGALRDAEALMTYDPRTYGPRLQDIRAALAPPECAATENIAHDIRETPFKPAPEAKCCPAAMNGRAPPHYASCVNFVRRKGADDE